MIYRTAYDTTVGKPFQMNKVIRSIQESAIRDGNDERDFGLVNSENFNAKPWFIAGKNDSEAQIPFFNHPILVELQDKDDAFCVDIRPFASFNKSAMNTDDAGEALIVKNKLELGLAKLRMGLGLYWVEKNPVTLREISFVPMAVFSHLISESISKRFGLMPRDQAVIAVISCYYYYTLFINRAELDENEVMRLTSSTMKALRYPSAFVEEVNGKMQPMEGVKDFARVIRETVDNTRLEGFDEGMLINLLISSWFGSGAREMVAVSLEHPPTWLALVYSAFVERSYKNTVIAKITSRYVGHKGENDFVRSLVSLINED